jgi:hypothetical protein
MVNHVKFQIDNNFEIFVEKHSQIIQKKGRSSVIFVEK